MSKRQFGFGKGLALYAVLSAVVIIAGLILAFLLGFNYASAKERRVEVSYDAVVAIADKEGELRELCDKAFDENGVGYSSSQTGIELDSQSLGETGVKTIVYKFSAGESENALKNAADVIRQRAKSAYPDAEVTVAVHFGTSETFSDALWRGAIALAVAAIVAVVYVGIRYGFACAFAGLATALNGALFTVGLFAIVRIPVYAYSPLVFAGLGATLAIMFFLVQCFALKADSKDPSFETLSAKEAVQRSFAGSCKRVLLIALSVAIAFVVLGAVAAAGTRLFFLSALIPLAVGLYSSLLLAPAVLVPLKARFDKLKSTRKRYAGKQKASAEEKAAAEE